MSASTYEYKTVALPQTVQGKRRRGVSEADLVAETLGELIHLEAVDGWEYQRSDILAAGTRGGMFSKEMRVTYYSVLVFRRMLDGVWPGAQAMPATPARAASGSASASGSAPRTAPTESPAPGPVRPARAPRTAPAPRTDPAPDSTPPSVPASRAAARPRAEPVVAPPALDDPTSPLAQGAILTTGGRIQADSSGKSASSATARPTPRPPLGSAQD